MKIPGSSPNESINKNRQTIDEWNTTSVKLKNYGQKKGKRTSNSCHNYSMIYTTLSLEKSNYK